MQTETSDKWQSISKDYIAGEMRPAHKHSRAQLLYACEGVMLAATGQGRRIIAPFQALWIPAGIEHTITFLSATKMRSLYFDKAEYKDIFESKSIKVFAATALIRELIATLFQHQFPAAKQEMRRLLLLLVRET
ncbi:AraC family ligand binding domain-containing protein, partial [Turicimonas muris]